MHKTLLNYRCLICYDILKIDKEIKLIFFLNKSENNLVKYNVYRLHLFIIMHKDFCTLWGVYVSCTVSEVYKVFCINRQ